MHYLLDWRLCGGLDEVENPKEPRLCIQTHSPSVDKDWTKARWAFLSFLVQTQCTYVGPEVLTMVVMNSSVFWDMTSCSPVKVNRRFGRTWALLHAAFLPDLLLNPEGGGDMFLRKFGWLSLDCMVPYPRRQNSSNCTCFLIFAFGLLEGVALFFRRYHVCSFV
jgi:hypothetical protein